MHAQSFAVTSLPLLHDELLLSDFDQLAVFERLSKIHHLAGPSIFVWPGGPNQTPVDPDIINPEGTSRGRGSSPANRELADQSKKKSGSYKQGLYL